MLPSLLLIDHDFSRQRDTRWWTAVYLCLNGLLDHIWWELLDSLHDNGHPDHVQGIDVDAVDLSLYLYTATGLFSSWFQWAATVWMQVMLSLKDSRHGLSSIYSLFLHFEKSATFGTVGYSKVFYGNTQWNFSLCWSAWTFFFLFVLIPACGDVALSFDACNEGGVTPASDEIVTNPASANELCFLQIHGALCMTEDESLSDCEWVLKSQKVYISWCRWLHKYFCW